MDFITRLLKVPARLLALSEEPSDEEYASAQLRDQGAGTVLGSLFAKEFDPHNRNRLFRSSITFNLIAAIGNVIILRNELIEPFIEAGSHHVIENILDHQTPLPLTLARSCAWITCTLTIKQDPPRLLSLAPYALNIAQKMEGHLNSEDDMECFSDALSTILHLTVGHDSNTLSVARCDGMIAYLMRKLGDRDSPQSLHIIVSIIRNMWLVRELRPSLIAKDIFRLLKALLDDKIPQIEYVCILIAIVFLSHTKDCMDHGIHLKMLQMFVESSTSEETLEDIRKAIRRGILHSSPRSFLSLATTPHFTDCIRMIIENDASTLYASQWGTLVDRIFDFGTQLGSLQRYSDDDLDAISGPNPIFDVLYADFDNFFPRDMEDETDDHFLRYHIKVLLHAGSGHLPSS